MRYGQQDGRPSPPAQRARANAPKSAPCARRVHAGSCTRHAEPGRVLPADGTRARGAHSHPASITLRELYQFGESTTHSQAQILKTNLYSISI
jgi:hypothetical protein